MDKIERIVIVTILILFFAILMLALVDLRSKGMLITTSEMGASY